MGALTLRGLVSLYIVIYSCYDVSRNNNKMGNHKAIKENVSIII
jgi:hypothetical protein